MVMVPAGGDEGGGGASCIRGRVVAALPGCSRGPSQKKDGD